VKPEKTNRALRGFGIGAAVFVLLSALCLLTPLRSPLLAVAGRDTPALEYRLQAQRDTMDALQARASGSRLSPAERASLERVQNDYVATRERIDARARMNARFTLIGLFDWVLELLPWLLAFGFALPVFGGLIGAQMSAQRVASAARPAPAPSSPPPSSYAPPSVPLDPPRPVPPPLRPASAPAAAKPVRQAYVHPAVAAAAAPASPPAATAPPSPPPTAARPLPGSPVVMPPAAAPPPQDWGFRHQPTPLENRPRAKQPPVRSPHTLNADVPDEDASGDASHNPTLRD
jgi:hypothetical protein